MTDRVLITCEHGGNRVPRAFAAAFAGAEDVLKSHRGYDVGALTLAKLFASRCDAPLFAATVTRLLVELNRSLGHPKLFSEFARPLPLAVRRELLDNYYYPHRRRVEEWIAAEAERGRAVWHVSVHSFTPVLDGKERSGDVGFLYDPARPRELRFCLDWQTRLSEKRPDLKVRRNYPYLGTSDGFTTYLRTRFPDERYAGIELEVNQRWVGGDAGTWRRLRGDLVETFRTVIGRAAARE